TRRTDPARRAHPRRQRATAECRGRLPHAAADRARLPGAQLDRLVAARRRPHPRTHCMSVVAIIDFDRTGAAIGSRLGDASTPMLRVDDLGPTRGDGVFETASLVHGKVQAIEAHLARFVQSAAMLELPRPDVEIWRDAVQAVAASLTSRGVAFGSLKFVL